MKLLQPKLGRNFVQFITTDYYTITASLLIHYYRITATLLRIVSNVIQLLCITTNHYYSLRINSVHYYDIIRHYYVLLRLHYYQLLQLMFLLLRINQESNG